MNAIEDRLKAITEEKVEEQIYRTICKDDKIEYRNEKGEFHNIDDKPAIIWPDGTKMWCKNGLSHRDNGKPAVIFADGSKSYCVNGNFIRHKKDIS